METGGAASHLCAPPARSIRIRSPSGRRQGTFEFPQPPRSPTDTVDPTIMLIKPEGMVLTTSSTPVHGSHRSGGFSPVTEGRSGKSLPPLSLQLSSREHTGTGSPLHDSKPDWQ